MLAEVFDPKDAQDVVIAGRQVCIIDDDDLSRGWIAALLAQRGVRVVEAADSAQLQRALDIQMPDCLLIDYTLVGENGLFVIERLKQRYASLAPIVMVTADETQRTAVRALRAGVSDFVVKRGMSVDELCRAVRRAIGMRMHDELRDNEVTRLRRSASFDSQTGLLTRAGLEDRIAAIARSALRRPKPFGLVALEIARLDEVQYQFGIAAADQVLRAFGPRLREFVRQTDICGAWDRGTFVFLIDTNVTPDSLASFVRRIVEGSTLQIDLGAVHLTLSVVAASIRAPDDGTDPTALLAELDRRLQAQKQGPREPSSADWMLISDLPAGTVDARNRRRDVRVRTLKQGRICLNYLQSTIDCTIRNLSAGGAHLRLPAPIAIPEYFDLKITEGGAPRRVRKCWHINIDMGVEFVDGKDPAGGLPRSEP